MPDLLERDVPLNALARAADDAARGRGSVALVTGEPGIGKTALVTTFAAQQTARARVLVGVCDDLGTPRPLGAFRDLAPELPRVADAMTTGVSPATFHTRVLEELRTGPAPTVLVIEDVHWADQATLDAVTVIGRRLADLPVLLLLTFRGGEVEPTSPLRAALDALQRTATLYLELAPLSRGAVAMLAGDDAERIFALTGGNPFFVSQMVAHGPDETPPSLANAALGRVSRCDPTSRSLLELVAMVPGRLATHLLDAVEPQWCAAAEQPERAQLLTSDARFVRFRHELTRAAVRSSVTPARRRLLHRRILDGMLEVGAEPADLVYHAEAAGADDVLAQHVLPAARQAEAVGSNREALAHFRRAAATVDRLAAEERADLWEGLARAAYLAGDSVEAMGAVTRAVDANEGLGRAADAGRCRSLRAHLLWFSGDGEAAWGEACSALRTLEPTGPPLELARAYVQASELAMLATRPHQALRWGRRALELGGDDDAVRARALVSIGAVRLQLDPDDVHTLLEGLRAAGDGGRHHEGLLALVALAFVNTQWVQPQRALAAAEHARRYAVEHEVDTMAGYVAAILAELLLRQGAWEEAARLAAAQLHDQTGWGRTVIGLQARTVLTALAVRRGDEDAHRLLADLAVDVDRTGELKRVAPVLEMQVEHALTRGGPLPVERFEELRRVVGDEPLREGGMAGRVAGWAALCALDWPSPPRAPAPHAAMVRRDWRGAADGFGSAGWSYERAVLLSLLDEREALAEALLIAREHSAGPLERRVSQRMQSLRLPVPRGPADSTRSNPANLTDRQVEVLTLLRRGCGNTEIAEQLSISPRTVEHHVAAILERLHVSSRAQAVARSGELGLS